MEEIVEGKARIIVERPKVVSREMEVFYNPVMAFNRDVTIRILSSKWLVRKRPMRIGLPMAGTGIRGIRILLEVQPERVSEVRMNDIDPAAVEAITSNVQRNGVAGERAVVSRMDANAFLSQDIGFDYVDIDPFGSPNPFLDAAVRRIAREGLLAVTATDTGGPCGSHPKTGFRKYWGKPLRDERMHETGLRMLIRKAQLVGMQYDRALVPIFCYYRDHYFRCVFLAKKGKSACDELSRQMGYYLHCRTCGRHEVSYTLFNDEKCSCGGKKEWGGPVYLGPLFDPALAQELGTEGTLGEDGTLGTIAEESAMAFPYFYELGAFCRAQGIPVMKKRQAIIGTLRKKGFLAGQTHFNPNAVKTDAPFEEFLEAMK